MCDLLRGANPMLAAPSPSMYFLTGGSPQTISEIPHSHPPIAVPRDEQRSRPREAPDGSSMPVDLLHECAGLEVDEPDPLVEAAHGGELPAGRHRGPIEARGAVVARDDRPRRHVPDGDRAVEAGSA